ncbi:MAG: diguanylate cyclase [Frankiales bacterium]|nr:diguanylate cyclase [Frankiales bacterium]
MHTPLRTRLHRHLLVVGGTLAVLGLGSVAVWTQLDTGTAVDRAQRQDRDALQGSLAGLTKQYFTATFLATATAAGSTAWTFDRRDAARLEHLRTTSPLTSYGAQLLDLDGSELAASSADFPAFTRPGLSDVVQVAGHDLVGFTVPVTRAGAPRAFLTAWADVRQWALQGYNRNLRIGEGAVPFVLDSRGVVAASGDVMQIGRRLDLVLPSSTATRSWHGRDVVVSSGNSGLGWHSVTVQPRTDWAPGVTASRNRAFTAVAALLTLVLGLLVWVLYRGQVVQRQLAEERLHDPLTGLPQRRVLELKLDAALVRQRRTGARVALLYADLDGFKDVNDRHGHGAGDQLLQAVAARLVEAVREEDLVVRLGGDEFAILIEGGEPADLRALVTRVVATVEQPRRIGRDVLTPRVSIGGAHACRAVTPDELLHAADLSMYEVKAGHRLLLTDLDALSPSVPRQVSSSRMSAPEPGRPSR